MKKSLLFVLNFLFLTPLFSQQEVVKTHDFDSMSLSRLLNHPFNDQKLIGVNSFFTFNQNNFDSSYYDYELLEISPTSSSFLVFGNVNRIVQEPVLFESNLIFSGNHSQFGNELFIYNGNGLQSIDIEPGIESSNPRYEVIDDKIYIYAKKGPLTQIFTLDGDLNLIQLTQEAQFNVKQVIKQFNQKMYYATFNNQDSLINIKYLDLSDSSTQNVLSDTGTDITLSHVLNGKLYFNLHFSSYNFGHYSSNRFIKLDLNNNVTSIFFESAPTYYNYPQSFVLNNELFITSRVFLELFNDSLQTLYRINQDDSFTPIFSLSEWNYFEEFISKNNSCHIITAGDYDRNSIHSFDGNNLTFLNESNFHVHYVSEKENLRYFISIQQYDSIYTELIQVDVNTNEINLFNITDSSVHPPYYVHTEQGAAWIGNDLYFIEGNRTGGMNEDIYKLTTTLSTEKIQDEAAFSIYPNPTNGNDLFIQAKNDIEIKIFTVDGKLVFQKKLKKGLNQILDLNLQSATYFISSENYMAKFVKN